MDDIRNLFKSEYSHQSNIEIKKDEHETPNYDRVSEPTSNNLFHCYKNEIEVEKDKSKALVGYQKFKKANHDNRAHDPGYCYKNRIKIGKASSQKSMGMSHAMEINKHGQLPK